MVWRFPTRFLTPPSCLEDNSKLFSSDHIFTRGTNFFMKWVPVANRGLRDLRDTHSPPTTVSSVLTTRPWLIRQSGLAPTERYHTSATTASRFWVETILHWTAYTWHWRIDILYEDMRICLHALAAALIPIVGEWTRQIMITPWNGNAFFIMGPWWEESSSHRRSFDVSFDVILNKLWDKQSICSWLWRHCNVFVT